MDNHTLLKKFIVQDLIGRGSPESIRDDDDLLLSGLVDSLGVVRLVSFIEKELKVPVPPEDVTLENFQTIGCISTYVRQHSTGRGDPDGKANHASE